FGEVEVKKKPLPLGFEDSDSELDPVNPLPAEGQLLKELHPSLSLVGFPLPWYRATQQPPSGKTSDRIANHLQRVARNLQHNHLDRNAIQALFLRYSSYADSDGHLINASRQESQCVEHGVFLCYVHAELLSWLIKHNYTIPATVVKWYSWRKLVSPKYRLPSLFSVRVHTTQLEDPPQNVAYKAELLHAALQTHGVWL
ncbi:hypothetical protein BBP40_005083, partial [Aspergillus hancockii]